jgi:16S rRNA (uracil1498-N3)-methyltransferase
VTAPHFFVERLVEGATVALAPADSRHALRSLRLRLGDEVSLADGRGLAGAGRLRDEENGLAVIEMSEVREVPRPSPRLSVAFAAPKGERLAWAVQKLGELGVDEALLLLTQRSIRAWDDPRRAVNALDRLRAVAREAAMQSHQPFVMDVAGPYALDEALAFEGRVILLDAGATTLLLRVAAALEEGVAEEREAIRLLVGPEGGWSPAELGKADEEGAAFASLGPSILRTETAAVVGAAFALAGAGRLG